jgi:hypothetical protein
LLFVIIIFYQGKIAYQHAQVRGSTVRGIFSAAL